MRSPVPALLAIVGASCAAPIPEAPAGPGRVVVAAVQCPSRMGDIDGNSDRLERLTRQAARAGAKIVVYPEAAVTGYLSEDLEENWWIPGRPLNPDFRGRSPAGVAQTVPGPTSHRFGRLALELGIYLAVPFVEADPASGRYFNTVVLLGPDGSLLLHYRKLYPWPYPEVSWATAGDRGIQFADTPYGRLGLLICFDVHRVPQLLAAQHVDTLLYPIAWVDDSGSDWFTKRLPEIARKHNVEIVGANWSVARPHLWSGYGLSRIIDREGNILAQAKSKRGDEVVLAMLPALPPVPAGGGAP